MNNDIEKVIAERFFLPPLVVQGKAHKVDMAITDVGELGVMAQVVNLIGAINMPFIITLKRRVQTVGIDKKYDSGEANKTNENVPPGKGKFHRFLRLGPGSISF